MAKKGKGRQQYNSQQLVNLGHQGFELGVRRATEVQFYWFVLALQETSGIGSKRMMEVLKRYMRLVDVTAMNGNNIVTIRNMVQELTGLEFVIRDNRIAIKIDESHIKDYEYDDLNNVFFDEDENVWVGDCSGVDE